MHLHTVGKYSNNKIRLKEKSSEGDVGQGREPETKEERKVPGSREQRVTAAAEEESKASFVICFPQSVSPLSEHGRKVRADKAMPPLSRPPVHRRQGSTLVQVLIAG